MEVAEYDLEEKVNIEDLILPSNSNQKVIAAYSSTMIKEEILDKAGENSNDELSQSKWFEVDKMEKFDDCVISNLVDQKTPGLRFYIKNEKNV